MSTSATAHCNSADNNIFARRLHDIEPPQLLLQHSPASSAFSSPLSLPADASGELSSVPRAVRSSSPFSLAAVDSPFLSDQFADLDFGMASNFDFQRPSSTDYTHFHHAGVPSFPQQWSSGGLVANSLQQHDRTASSNGHLRSPSASTIGSNTARFSQVQRAVSRKSQNQSSYHRPQSSGHQLPTPTSTPTRKTFANQQHLDSVEQLLMNNQYHVRQQHAQHDDDVPDMSHSNRQSYSSASHDAITPMTAVSDYRDSALRAHGENNLSDILVWLQNDSRLEGTDSMTNHSLPKLERTLTDAYNDELYFQQPMHAPAPPSNPNYLMAQGNKLVQDRLHQAAAMARSPSSSSNQSVVSHYKTLPSQWRGQRRDGSDADYQVSPRTESEPKTISPKDAMLDYKSTGNETPLFTQASSDFTFAVAPAVAKPSYQASSNLPFGMGPWTSELQQSTLSSAPVPSYGAFAQPTIPASYGMPMSHGLAAPQSSLRRTISKQSDNPEFPAHLTSMESSASESGFPSSSAASSAMTMHTSKPDTSADTGTYSCTYHGCSQRFTTPQKLQKHKRDAHRAHVNITPGVGSGMTAAQLMERNSQTGPHKCDRINPTTGKPCSTVFSRPYDLTRHEDTIHNIRKQKVRCALCTEEKTFSRADALTRHMRVVHPEVDFPGKHRKRGGRGD
jgi:Zinc finger, C2H2 type